MKRESRLTLEIWDMIRDHVPPAKREEMATSLLLLMQDYGMDRNDLCDVLDEDVHLSRAFRDVFDEEGDDYDDEDY